jgi:2-desacetyl-2-hydroxyethyl bacteriochlorophyllide A dehydrogenase
MHMQNTTAPRNSSRLVFNGAKQVALESRDVPPPAAGQVRARASWTLMSTGTEGIVFNRLFDSGTHWDKWVKYPFYPGYAAIGAIEAVGEGVTAWKPGDMVVWRGNHAALQVVDAHNVWPVPADIEPSEGVWFALAKIASMGARAAEHRLGERVLVIGAGPIGQMAVRWAAATGPRTLTVVDTVPFRLRLARDGGASDVIEKPIDAAREEALRINGGALPDLVIDTTGNAAVFQRALGLARDFGRVILLGDTGSPESQHLTSDVMIRGVRIAAAHDGHENACWNSARIADLLFALVRAGRFNLKGLNTHTFKPAQCVEAYTLASTRRVETMGILFDWR